ncbi:MAG: tRNA (adenosine(37)-N6)-threonylcarbamoyltransferase complex ATPase subunit type 1 TsaE [Bacteroidota bacterium]
MTGTVSRSAEETEALGREFAHQLRPGDVVALIGTLGSGKTRFVAGVCSGLGVSARVTSPTFTLINEYHAPFGLVAHADMYRIRRRSEVGELGLEEYFNDRCICLIEWAETILDLLPPLCWRVTITHGAADNERLVVTEVPAGRTA